MGKQCRLRKADIKDAKRVFEWKNDADCVKNSISGQKVSWENHVQWFERVIKDADRQLFIFEADGYPAGQIRLDIEEDVALISYCIAKEFRGQHLGKEILCLVEKEAAQREIKVLKAEVLLHNKISQKLFLQLGYIESAGEEILRYKKVL